MMSFDDFSKLDLRIGTILLAESVPDADRLIRLEVDLGEDKPRQIIAGIAEYVSDLSTLPGKQITVVANLEPRTLRGFESRGMVLGVNNDESFSFLSPDRQFAPGAKVR